MEPFGRYQLTAANVDETAFYYPKPIYYRIPCITELKRCHQNRNTALAEAKDSRRALDLMGIEVAGPLDIDGQINSILGEGVESIGKEIQNK